MGMSSSAEDLSVIRLRLALPATSNVLGPEYIVGQDLVDGLYATPVDIQNSTMVWQISSDEDGGQIGIICDGKSELITAQEIILATGAMERPMPIPGWTTPGVLSVGAAQTMLKSSGVAAEGAIFVGSGPLLYLTAAQYVRAGVKPRAILGATPFPNFVKTAWQLPEMLYGSPLFKNGASLISGIGRAGVPIIRFTQKYRIDGEETATGISFQTFGQRKYIEASHIFLHLGVVPNIHLASAAGCEVMWDPLLRCWNVVSNIGGKLQFHLLTSQVMVLR
jgi:hypothetical protein